MAPSDDQRYLSTRVKVPPPITVPGQPIPISGRKSPNSKVFTPFRYLTTRRNRTVSAASAEAVMGTAVSKVPKYVILTSELHEQTNTVVGSPTASMHSQNPLQPPPVRDPARATQQWREDLGIGPKDKIQRPGVVFDVADEPSQDKQRLRPVKLRQTPSAFTNGVANVNRVG
jgi:hypothetical protein